MPLKIKHPAFFACCTLFALGLQAGELDGTRKIQNQLIIEHLKQNPQASSFTIVYAKQDFRKVTYSALREDEEVLILQAIGGQAKHFRRLKDLKQNPKEEVAQFSRGNLFDEQGKQVKAIYPASMRLASPSSAEAWISEWGGTSYSYEITEKDGLVQFKPLRAAAQ